MANIKYKFEDDEFCMSSSKISVQVSNRNRKIPIIILPQSIPRYLAICYDEYTRNTMKSNIMTINTVNYGYSSYESENTKHLSFPFLETVNDTENASTEIDSSTRSKIINQYGRKILHHYDPTYKLGNNDKSTHGNPITLSTMKAADSNQIIIKISKVPEVLEPLFGTLTLYSITNDQCIRISESFHFDMTSQKIRIKYKQTYKSEELIRIDKIDAQHYQASIDPATTLKMCMFNIPKHVIKNDIIIIIQISKVLTGDIEKAIAPYIRNTTEVKIDENIRRLHMYRQMIGLGVLKLYEDNSMDKKDIRCPLYSVKTCLNDTLFNTMVKDILMDATSAVRSKYESLTIELGLKIAEIPITNSSELKLPEGFLTSSPSGGPIRPVVPLASHMTQLSTKASHYNWSGDDLYTDESDIYGIQRLNYLKPPSSIDNKANETATTNTQQHTTTSTTTMSFSSPLSSSMSSSALSAPLEMLDTVDHTLFLYPLSLDRFENRNLCVKVELLEFAEIEEFQPVAEREDFINLKNIYNNQPGPLFVYSAHTIVHYHHKNPTFLDEIKIRLPEVVTHRHYLRFTIQHIHVKPKTTGNRATWGSIFSSTQDIMTSDLYTVVGKAYLCLLKPSGNILSDGESILYVNPIDTGDSPSRGRSDTMTRLQRSDTIDTFKSFTGFTSPMNPSTQSGTVGNNTAGTISLTSSATSAIPILKIGTKTMSSLISSCPFVQGLFLSPPHSLGYLPTSIQNDMALVYEKHIGIPTLDEKELYRVLRQFTSASDNEIIKHFLVIFRILARVLCGGSSGKNDLLYSNPYTHSTLRCQAFICLLHILSRIPPESAMNRSMSTFNLNSSPNMVDDSDRYSLTTPSSSSGLNNNENLLNTFFDIRFDEEILITEDIEDNMNTMKPFIHITSSKSSKPTLKDTKNSSKVPDFSDEFITRIISVDEQELNRNDPPGFIEDMATNSTITVKKERSFIQKLGLDKSSSGNSSHSTSTNSLSISGQKTATEVYQQVTAILNEESMKQAPTYNNEEMDLSTSMIDMMSSTSSPRNSPAMSDLYPSGNTTFSINWNESNKIEKKIHFITNPSHLSIPSEDQEKYLTELSTHLTQEIERYLVCILYEQTVDQIIVEIIHLSESSRFHLINRKPIFEAEFTSNNNDVIGNNEEEDEEVEDILELSKSSSMNSMNSIVTLRMPPSYHNKLEGYSTRQGRIIQEYNSDSTQNSIVKSVGVNTTYDSSKSMKESNNTSSSSRKKITTIQWWPWLYEVVSYQWISLLELVQSSNLTSSLSSDVTSNKSMRQAYSSSRGQPTNNNNDISTYLKYSEKQLKELKQQLLDHGHVLLKLIVKSLLLRIHRNKLTLPIHLDNDILLVFDQMFTLISKDIHDKQTSVIRARRLAYSISSCIRFLLNIIVPSQACQLISSYFTIASRMNTQKSEGTEATLIILHDLSMYDYLVAINYIDFMDTPQTIFTQLIERAARTILSTETGISLTCSLTYRLNIESRLNGDIHSSEEDAFISSCYPPSYWLIDLLIYETFRSYRQIERKLKEKSLKLLKELLLKLSYDQRYSSYAMTYSGKNDVVFALRQDARSRISMMYLPILREIVKDTSRLMLKSYDAYERRDILPLLLHVLEELPIDILREELRHYCYQIYNDDDSSNSTNNTTNSNEPIRIKQTTMTTSESGRTVTVARRSPQQRRRSTIKEKELFHTVQKEPIVILLTILFNLVIDTFEYKTYNPTHLTLNTGSGVTAGYDRHHGNIRRSSFNTNNAKLVGNDVTSRLDRLEAILQNRGNRKEMHVTIANAAITTNNNNNDGTNTTGGGGTAAMTAASSNITAGSTEGRKWVKRAEKLHTSQKNLGITFDMYHSSLISISHGSSMIIIKILHLLIEECSYKSMKTIQFNVNISPTNIDENLSLIIQNCLFTILHGLYCHQTQYVVEALFKLAIDTVSRFHIEHIITYIGDTLQDWCRIILRYFAYNNRISIDASKAFSMCLCHSYFIKYGNITLITDIFKAVLYDVMEYVITHPDGDIKTTEELDQKVEILSKTLYEIKTECESNIELSQPFDSKSIISSSAAAAAAASSIDILFYYQIITLMNELEVIFEATVLSYHYIKYPILHGWDGSTNLDIKYDSHTSITTTTTSDDNSVKPRKVKSMVGIKGRLDSNAIFDSFIKAADVFDAIRLPRCKIRWYEMMIRLNDELYIKNNNSGVIRWKIYEICSLVKDSWKNTWAPRQPISWSKDVKESTTPAGSPTKNRMRDSRSNTVTSPISTSIYASTKSVSSVLSINSTYSLSPSNKVLLWQTVKNIPIGRPWTNEQQYENYIYSLLYRGREICENSGLCYLVERYSHELIHLYRLSNNLTAIANEYSVLSKAFSFTMENGGSATNSFVMGSYYWVQYVGQGVPEYFRQEYIYRNANNMHISEFHHLIQSYMEYVVEEGVKVIMSNKAQPIESDYNTSDVIIFITTVKPLFDIPTKSTLYNMNQTHKFEHSIPFTKIEGGNKTHAQKMNDQWKRNITLYVAYDFPYINNRQVVVHKEIQELTPIEVAIDDIKDRIKSFQEELTSVVLNNIMRLIQGSIMPQVNAGAAEVAKVFLQEYKTIKTLHHEKNITSNKLTPLQRKLQETLVDFLIMAKRLLMHSHDIIYQDTYTSLTSADHEDSFTGGGGGGGSGSNTNNGPVHPSHHYYHSHTSRSISSTSSANYTTTTTTSNTIMNSATTTGSHLTLKSPMAPSPATSQYENVNIIWQQEMTKGYDHLVELMAPYLPNELLRKIND